MGTYKKPPDELWENVHAAKDGSPEWSAALDKLWGAMWSGEPRIKKQAAQAKPNNQ